MLFTVIALAQNCITVTTAVFTNPSGDNQTWNLNLTYTASGNKSLEINVYCGSTVILSPCLTTNGSGSQVYSGLICNGGINTLKATFVPHTGNCGSAACGPSQTLPPGGGPLPVKMASFFTQRIGNTVQLNWQTETEINSKEFVIQKKIGSNFVDIATVPSKNAANGSSYFFVDQNSEKGFSQYRLKIVDFDYKTGYSETKTVKGTASDTQDFTIFPNPSRGDAKVTISDISSPTDVQLLGVTGNLLKTYSMNNRNSVDLNGLKSGVYLIKVINKATGTATVKKLTVIN